MPNTSKLLDQHGKPIDTSALREPQLSRVSTLNGEHDAHPARGITPARIHAIMRAAEEGDLIPQLELADDMEERDTQIFSELSKRKTALVGLDWQIEPPANATPLEKQQAEQVAEWVRELPGFKATLQALMDAVLKGFACTEQWWEMDGGIMMPRHKWQPQRLFCTSQADRNALHLRNPSVPDGEPLRQFNWLVHRHPARNGYLARQSLARVLMFPYLYKNYSVRDMAEFLEIYGLPLRLGKYPSGASDAEKRTLLRAVTEIGHNAAGIIPSGMEIDFQNAAQGTQVPFDSMINRMDAAISKAIIGQTLTSGEGQHGTQALGNVHNEIRLDILAADAELLAETLSTQLIAPLALFNLPGLNPRRLPKFVFDVPEPEDLKLFAESLPTLAASGMQIGLDWVHKKLRIPKAGPGEALLQGAAPTPARTPARTPAQSAALAATPPETQPVMPPHSRVMDAIDDLVEEALQAYEPLLAPLVQPLISELDDAIARGESINSLRDRLPALFARLSALPPGADLLAEQLARAGFVAATAGHALYPLQPDDINTGA